MLGGSGTVWRTGFRTGQAGRSSDGEVVGRRGPGVWGDEVIHGLGGWWRRSGG
jgi:hypothetical protein